MSESIKQAFLGRWLVLLCALFLGGCAGSVCLWYVSLFDLSPFNAALVGFRQPVRADQGGYLGAVHAEHWPITVLADPDTLALLLHKSADQPDPDKRLGGRAEFGIWTDHGQDSALVFEVLEEGDVDFALGIAQDHGLLNVHYYELRHPAFSRLVGQAELQQVGSVGRYSVPLRHVEKYERNSSHFANLCVGGQNATIQSSDGFIRGQQFDISPQLAVLTEPSEFHWFIKARKHGPRNTPAAHRVLSNWLQSFGPNQEATA